MGLYGPYSDTGNDVLARMVTSLGLLIEQVMGAAIPADESVTDAKVADDAAIAQAKIAGLVDDLAARATDAELAAVNSALTTALAGKQATIPAGTYAGTPAGVAATAVVTTGAQTVAGVKTFADDMRVKGTGVHAFLTGSTAEGAGQPLGPPPGVITLADGGAGSLPAGTYQYAAYEEDGHGATTLGPVASITIGANRCINVTRPHTRRGMKQYVLCRTAAGGSTFKIVHNFGGANGYFMTGWVDNRLDASLGATAPTTDTTQFWTFEVTGLPEFRLHPTLSADANDLALLTKKPGLVGSYAFDAYGTVVARDSAGACFVAQHIGTTGDLFYGEYLPTTDPTTGEVSAATATAVFEVLAQGSTEIRPMKTDASALTVIPRAALDTGKASLQLESLAGSAALLASLVHRGTGIGFALTHSGTAGDAFYVNLTAAGNAAAALNLTHQGTGYLISTNKGFLVQTGGNLNLLSATAPNYLNFLQLYSLTAFDTPLIVRGLTAGGHAVNLVNFMPNPTAGTIPFAVGPTGLPKWNHSSVVQTTVGAAGGASAPPATPTKWAKVMLDDGLTYVIPVYAAA